MVSKFTMWPKGLLSLALDKSGVAKRSRWKGEDGMLGITMTLPLQTRQTAYTGSLETAPPALNPEILKAYLTLCRLLYLSLSAQDYGLGLRGLGN